jgi:hypothetical protein
MRPIKLKSHPERIEKNNSTFSRERVFKEEPKTATVSKTIMKKLKATPTENI